MTRHLKSLVLATSLVVAAQGAQAATVVVEVQDNQFVPSEITICLGDTVRWEWTGNVPHTTTSGTPNCVGDGGELWDSGVLSTGAFFEYTFDVIPPECASDESEGDNTCDYFCIPHCANMSGIITIVESIDVDADVDLGTNKLRVAKGGAGRGGTVKGVELLTGVESDGIEPGSVDVTLTLSGSFGDVSDTRSLSTTRGKHAGRWGRTESKDIDIVSAKLTPTSNPNLLKVLVKYETNGIDLSGPLGLVLDIDHTVDGGCGPTVLVGTASGPVAH